MDNSSIQNMLDMYLFETNSLLDQLDEILLAAEKAQDFSSDDINEIFRIMHTIKGSSAMMQFTSLTTLAHHIEDLFYYIRENDCHSEVSSSLFNLLFRGSDFIKLQVEKIQSNEPLDDCDEFTAPIEELLASLKNATSGSSEAVPEAAPAPDKAEAAPPTQSDAAAPQTEPGTGSICVYFEEDLGMENVHAFILVSSLKEAEISFTFTPEDIEGNPDTAAYIIEHGFYLHFKDGESLTAALSIVKNALNLKTYEIFDRFDELPEDTGSQTDSSGKAPSSAGDSAQAESPSSQGAAQGQNAAAPRASSGGKQNLISVNLSKLDRLMAIVGEIVITESMVTSNPDLNGLKLDRFTKSARQLRKLTDDLQDTVMSIRMVPVSGIFQKMNRIVRDMSQSLEKPAKLVTIGADTEVDKTIVDSIGDPIMHMVRNSMDHGLEECPEDRVRSGKDPEGTITLSAEHTGSEVVISIQDDGRGVDTAKVLAKAKENNLLTKPETEYSQRDILQLLLMPGFSTNDDVTEYSGRGVGMDVVKKSLEKVGGIITMTTEEGQGSCTKLKIPLTLSIVDGMEIAVGKSIFTVPIHNIRQSFKVNSDEIVYDAARGEMIRKGEEFYPILRIHELFDIPTEVVNIEDGILIWVEASEKSYCLFVDDLLGQQRVVVKPLPIYLNAYHIKDFGISGCTILGDGSISIILDVAYLYDSVANVTI